MNTVFVGLSDALEPGEHAEVAHRRGYSEDAMGLNEELLNVLGRLATGIDPALRPTPTIAEAGGETHRLARQKFEDSDPTNCSSGTWPQALRVRGHGKFHSIMPALEGRLA